MSESSETPTKPGGGRESRRRKALLAALFLALAAAIHQWLPKSSQGGLFHATPGHYFLGSLPQGSTVQLSAKFFFKERPDPESRFAKARKKLPTKLRAFLDARADAANMRDAQSAHPAFFCPHATKFNFRKFRTNPYRPEEGMYCHAGVTISLNRPGEFQETFRIELRDGRISELPYRITSRAIPDPAGPRILVTETPFEAFSTSEGDLLVPAANLFGSLERPVDFLFSLPKDLTPYDTILLAESPLSKISAASEQRVDQFVKRGGMLILAANKFYGSTTASANRILKDRGLTFLASEVGQEEIVPQDSHYSKTVDAVKFWRASPIAITNPDEVEVLVATPDGANAYVALAQRNGEGPILVISQSLWWKWLASDESRTGAFQLMKNVLSRQL